MNYQKTLSLVTGVTTLFLALSTAAAYSTASAKYVVEDWSPVKKPACVGVGGIVNSTVSPAYQTNCCPGLVQYNINYSAGKYLLGGSGICLKGSSSLKKAVKIMSKSNACTESTAVTPTLTVPYQKSKNIFMFALKTESPICMATCEVNTKKQSAKINWMCTGLLK
jgi:hypothetical protein